MATIDDIAYWQSLEQPPDAITPLRGFRIMTVRGKRRVIEGHRTTWQTNTVTASCMANKTVLKRLPRQDRQHRAPFAGCTCGNYNAFTPDIETWRMQYPWLFVTESEGQMYMGSLGFRAERTTLIAATPLYTVDKWDQPQNEPVQLTIERQALFLQTRGIRTYRTPPLLIRDYPSERPHAVLPKVYCWDVE